MKEELLEKETHATAEECTRQKDLLVPFLMIIISLSICWGRIICEIFRCFNSKNGSKEKWSAHWRWHELPVHQSFHKEIKSGCLCRASLG